MAFWGAMVPKDQPYTLQLDGDRKRVRITQATVGDYSGWPYAWSKLKCAVGSKPPVCICSLSKALPFCQLDLEFEGSEEVVFSIKGPQGIHLSGYYVSTSAAAKKETSNGVDDLSIDCHSEEDIVMAEKEEGKKLTAEEDIGHTHRLADGGQGNNCDDDHNLMIVNVNDNEEDIVMAEKEEGKKLTAEEDIGHTHRLADGGQGNNCDDDHNLMIVNVNDNEEDIVMAEKEEGKKLTAEEDIGHTHRLADGGQGNNGDDDHNLMIVNVNDNEEDIVMAEKEEGKKLTAEEDIGHTHRLADGGQDNNCDDDHNLMIVNVNDNDQLVNAETNEDDDEKTAKEQEEIIYAFDSELPEEEDDDYVLCIRKSARTAKKMVEKVGEDADKVTVEPNRMVNDADRVDSISKETTDATRITFNDASEMLDHNMVHAQNIVSVSHIKVEEQTPSSDKVIGNPYSGEGHCGNENIVIVLPENAEDHKPIDDIGEEEQVQKKKQKTIAKENEKSNCVNPCKLRTLSNGMIIEDLAMGKSNGRKAVQGRKVKIFYSARLRNSGLLIETNVGEKPLKFCVGDNGIIKGFNIGVEGMHIGGKRRLITPPAFGYGGKVIAQLPPDSWLVYDIELVGVKVDKRKCD